MQDEFVKNAFAEWQQAISIFNNAQDKDDINFAIYNLEAKKQKYLLALKRQGERECMEEDDFQ